MGQSSANLSRLPICLDSFPPQPPAAIPFSYCTIRRNQGIHHYGNQVHNGDISHPSLVSQCSTCVEWSFLVPFGRGVFLRDLPVPATLATEEINQNPLASAPGICRAGFIQIHLFLTMAQRGVGIHSTFPAPRFCHGHGFAVSDGQRISNPIYKFSSFRSWIHRAAMSESDRLPIENSHSIRDAYFHISISRLARDSTIGDSMPALYETVGLSWPSFLLSLSVAISCHGDLDLAMSAMDERGIWSIFCIPAPFLHGDILLGRNSCTELHPSKSPEISPLSPSRLGGRVAARSP